MDSPDGGDHHAGRHRGWRRRPTRSRGRSRAAIAGAAAAADALPLAVLSADRDGTIRWANAAAESLLGESARLDEVLAGLGVTVPRALPAIVRGTVSHAGGGARLDVDVHLTPGADGLVAVVAPAAADPAALAGLQAEHDLLTENLQDAVLRTSPDGRIISGRRSLRLLIGDDPLVHDARTIADLLDERDRPRARRVIDGLTAAAPVRTLTARLLQGAAVVWVDLTLKAKVVESDDGPTLIRELHVVIRDITERRWAEEELRRREHMLRSVTGSSPIGIFAVSDGVWTFVNDRLTQLTGLAKEALQQGELWRYLDLDAPLAQDELPPEGEYRYLAPGGEERWFAIRLRSEEETAGTIVVGTVEDVTDAHTSRQHSSLMAAVVASTSDLVAIIAPSGRVSFINPAGRQLLGLGPSDSESQLTAETMFLPEDWADIIGRGLPAAADAGDWSGEARLRSRDGSTRPVSVVLIAHRDTRGHVDRLSLIARDLSPQKAVEARLEREASHDQLTGLPLRSVFYDATERALATAARAGASVGVLFCDLDRFKTVNDNLGHAAGDRLLRGLADRLTGALRGGDLAARVGGDEFLVLLPSVDSLAEATEIAERLRSAIDQPLPVDRAGTSIRPTFSIGVAVSDGSTSVQALISRADSAMYRAKELGKNRVCAEDGRQRRAAAAASLVAEQSLRGAIEAGDLRLRYQPIVELASGRISGAEALVRWAHPDRGILSPRSFISLAEDTGLVGPLGEWVLTTAIRDAAGWAADGRLPDGISVSVNLSARQLLDGGLADRVAAMLRATGLPPSLLMVELTERAVASDEPTVQAELARFRDHGVRVAVDDFGTGYSSLAQLRRFHVDALKLDGAFVAGLGNDAADDAIVTTLIGLADALGLTAIAEGVESTTQHHRLLELGCGLGQGFLFSEPLEPEDLGALLNRGRVWPTSAPR